MEVEVTTLGERGQTVIPKSIREQMAVSKGTLFSVALVDKDTLIFRRVDKRKLLGDFKRLRASVQKFSEAEIVGEVKKVR